MVTKRILEIARIPTSSPTTSRNHTEISIIIKGMTSS